MIRATLESLAYQVNDVLAAMKADSGIELAALKVDGGASANNLLMQMQSDLSGIGVQRGLNAEATALGAAYLAGLAVGVFKDPKEAVKLCVNEKDVIFPNEENHKKYLKFFERYKKIRRFFAQIIKHSKSL